MLKQSFQWLPIALGMKSKPLTGAYKAWHYRSPACLPNLISSCCCPLAHPDSATLGSSSFPLPASGSLLLLFLPPGPLTPTLYTDSSVSSSGPMYVSHACPQKAFSTHEAIQHIFTENLLLARCSSELQSSCPPAVYIRVGET